MEGFPVSYVFAYFGAGFPLHEYIIVYIGEDSSILGTSNAWCKGALFVGVFQKGALQIWLCLGNEAISHTAGTSFFNEMMMMMIDD